MTTSLKIPFAVNEDGRVVDVRDLPKNTPGQFHCAECKNLVTLKQGEVRTWHFAHKADTNCMAAFETALHALAKQILVEERYIRTPALVCRLYEQPSKADITLCHERTIRWAAAGEVEQWLDGVRPDFMVASDEGPLIVEVAVTHFSEVDKLAKLKDLGIPSLEVDLSDAPRDITAAEVRRRILDATSGKKWIFYPGEAEARAQLKTQREEEHAKHLAALARERADRAAAAETEARAREAERREKIERANELFRQSTNAEKLAFIISKLGTLEHDWPELLDVPVRGESSIQAPRRIWQADVFRRFLHGKMAMRSAPAVSVEFVAGWLTLRYVMSPKTETSVRVAVWDYLSTLEKSGYLHRRVRQEFEIQRDTLPDRPSSATQGLFWARDFVDPSQFWRAARATGIHIPPGMAMSLIGARSNAKFRMSEDEYARSVAATLNVAVEQAVAFLTEAGFFVRVDVTH